MFRLFGKKKKSDSFVELLTEVSIQKYISDQLNQAKNFRKLGRNVEAASAFRAAEDVASRHAAALKGNWRALALLAYVYLESEAYEKAASIIQSILGSEKFNLTDSETQVLGSELQKAQRALILEQPASDATDKPYTQIYACQNCGRLHNYITVPCPHCEWMARNVNDLALSIALSNSRSPIPLLLMAARGISNGQALSKVFGAGSSIAKSLLSSTDNRVRFDEMLELLHANAQKQIRMLPPLRRCASCDETIFMSTESECGHCGAEIRWPPLVQIIVCMDTVLWLLEQRIEPKPESEFAQLVCLLVAMREKALRKQELPSQSEAAYTLRLLQKVQTFFDEGRASVLDCGDLSKITIYVMNDRAKDDTQMFAAFIQMEFESLVGILQRKSRL